MTATPPGVGGRTSGRRECAPPGAGGKWAGDIHNLSLIHTTYSGPYISTDGRGDFATITTPNDATAAPRVVVSVYDAAPPTLSAPSVTGTLLAGEAVTIGVNASDEVVDPRHACLDVRDGGIGSGAAVTHTYAAAGTYTLHVSVTDGSGNSAAKDVAVTVASPQATLTSAKFTAKWKVSRVRGTLDLAGTAPRAGTYAIDVSKGETRKIHASFTLNAGAFTRKLKLPAKLVPGTYHVSLVSSDAQVKGAARDVKLAAPASESSTSRSSAARATAPQPARSLVRQ